MNDLSGYHAAVSRRHVAFDPAGFDDIDESRFPAGMFPHQIHGTIFALRTGRSALFYDTGLGKTIQALTWGNEIVRRTNKPVLMLAPLAVAAQHVAEAEKFGIDAVQSRLGIAPSSPKIAITNYERLEKCDPSEWP